MTGASASRNRGSSITGRNEPSARSARVDDACFSRNSPFGVITTIGYFQFFAEPYVMTGGGGPLNATLSVGLLMYKAGFRWWSMGYAAAVAFILFIVVLALTAIQFRLQRGKGDQGSPA